MAENLLVVVQDRNVIGIYRNAQQMMRAFERKWNYIHFRQKEGTIRYGWNQMDFQHATVQSVVIEGE